MPPRPRIPPGDWKLLLGMALVGTPVLLAVLRLAVRRPVPASATPLRPEGPPPRAGRVAAPWLAGAVASVALMVAADHRGMALNVYDVLKPVPQEPKSPSAQETALRAELEALRREARAGRAPLDRYRERRAEVARELGGGAPRPLPPPQPLPPTTGSP